MVDERDVGGERWRGKALWLGAPTREIEPASSSDEDEEQKDEEEPTSATRDELSRAWYWL